MDGSFTWASSIPLMSLLVAVFSAGVVVTKVNAMSKEIKELKDDLLKKIKEVEDHAEKKIKEVEDDGEKYASDIKKDLIERIHDLKRDHERSSEDQGRRLGDLEAEAKATKVHMDLTAKHYAVPHEIK